MGECCRTLWDMLQHPCPDITADAGFGDWNLSHGRVWYVKTSSIQCPAWERMNQPRLQAGSSCHLGDFKQNRLRMLIYIFKYKTVCTGGSLVSWQALTSEGLMVLSRKLTHPEFLFQWVGWARQWVVGGVVSRSRNMTCFI